jgi:hypothetical protein
MVDAQQREEADKWILQITHLENYRMNLPQKVKEIYRELRMMLGDEFPAQELLESAALLVEVVEDNYSMTAYRLQDFWVPFTEKSVDEVIANDGWKVLSNEDWWRQQIGEDDVMSVQARMQLKNYGLEIAA